jgi:hypothetical protein
MMVPGAHHWTADIRGRFEHTAWGHKVLHTHALQRAICGSSIWSVGQHQDIMN